METWSPLMAIGKLSTAPMVAGTMMGHSGIQVSANCKAVNTGIGNYDFPNNIRAK